MFLMYNSALFMVLAFAGLFSASGWFAELCSHFYLQYLVILLFLFVVLIATKNWKLSLIVLPFVVICLFKIVPLYFPRPQIAIDQRQRIALMTINVHTENRNINGVVERIRHSNPDVICFEEVNEWWVNELKSALAQEYPFLVAEAHSDNFGIAEFSKMSAQKHQIMQIGNPPVPAIWCQYLVNEKPISIISIHTLPPGNPAYLHVRNSAFDALAKRCPDFGDCFVIAGDLNCTPFSADFDKFVRDTGTYNTMQGYGPQCSWPALVPLYPILLIPIDHVLATPNLVCTRRGVGLPMGSDHFPVFAELFYADTTLRK